MKGECFVCILKDLDRAQGKLKESIDKLKLVPEYTYDWEIFWDENLNLGYMNRAFERMFGYKREEFVKGKVKFGELFFKEDLKTAEKIYKEILEKKTINDFKIRAKDKKGKEMYISISSQPIIVKNKFRGIRTSIRNITEKELNHIKLKENEKLMKEITNHLEEAVFSKDLEGNYTFLNPIAAKYLGTTPDKGIGKKANDFLSKDEVKKINTLDKLNMQGKKVNETEILTVEGEKRKLNTIQSPMRNNKGKIIGIAGIVRDVTESEKINLEIRENERKHNIILDNLKEEVHLWKLVRDKNNKIKTWALVDANKSALKTWNKKKEKVIGKTTNEIFKYDATKQFLPMIEKIFKSKKAKNWESYFPPTNQYLAMTTVPFGEYFVSAGKDITKEKEAQLKLKEKEEVFEAISQNTTDGIYLTDKNGDCVYANKAWLKMAGLTLKEAMGKGWMKALHPEDKKTISENWYKTVKSNGKWGFEYRFLTKGKTHYIYGRAKPIKINNVLTGYVGTNTDLTEIKRYEEDLKKNEKECHLMFENMTSAFALHEIITNKKGEPIDYVFLEVNKIFEELTGLKKMDVLGKRVTKVIPGIRKDPMDFIGRYGEVALKNKRIKFEAYSEDLKKWFRIRSYSPKKGLFVAIFDDITDHKTELKLLEDEIKLLKNEKK